MLLLGAHGVPLNMHSKVLLPCMFFLLKENCFSVSKSSAFSSSPPLTPLLLSVLYECVLKTACPNAYRKTSIQVTWETSS